MATALVNYGKLHSIDLKPENVEEFENFPGEGVRGKIDGNDIYIGSKKIAARAGYDIPGLRLNPFIYLNMRIYSNILRFLGSLIFRSK